MEEGDFVCLCLEKGEACPAILDDPTCEIDPNGGNGRRSGKAWTGCASNCLIRKSVSIALAGEARELSIFTFPAQRTDRWPRCCACRCRSVSRVRLLERADNALPLLRMTSGDCQRRSCRQPLITVNKDIPKGEEEKRHTSIVSRAQCNNDGSEKRDKEGSSVHRKSAAEEISKS